MTYVRTGMGRGGGAGPDEGFWEQFVQSGATMPIVSDRGLVQNTPCNQAPAGRTMVIRSGGYHYADNVASQRDRERVASYRRVLGSRGCVRTGRTATGGDRSHTWNEEEYCCPPVLATPPVAPPGVVPPIEILPPVPFPDHTPIGARQAPWYLHPLALVGGGVIGAIVLVRLVQG